MAVRAKDTLKSWFRTGLYPTQEQFWDWMDSYYHKLEGINFDDVTGLIEYLNERNAALLATIDEIITEAAKALQYERRIPLTLEKSSQDMLIAEEMTIYRVDAVNVASLTITVDGSVTSIPVNDEAEVLIPAMSVATFSIVTELTDATAYLYIRAKVTPEQ
jgi:hypothetical protein